MKPLIPTTMHVPIRAATHPGHAALRAATEDHHQVFHLPDHDMYCVVAIADRSHEGAEGGTSLHAECWEVDAAGEKTGLHAPIGLHGIPHHQLSNDVVQVDDIVELMTAIMVERLAKRKKALSLVDDHPLIKSLPDEQKRKELRLPRGINDPYAI